MIEKLKFVLERVENIVGKGENAGYAFNPLPDNKILDWSNLKQTSDHILKCI